MNGTTSRPDRCIERTGDRNRQRSRLPRNVAVGKRGSIAVVERFQKRKEILCRITIPEHQPDFEFPRRRSVDRFTTSGQLHLANNPALNGSVERRWTVERQPSWLERPACDGSGGVWFTDLKDFSSNTPTSILRYDIAAEMVDVRAA